MNVNLSNTQVVPRNQAWAIKAVSFFLVWPACSLLFLVTLIPFLLIAWFLIPLATLVRKEGKLSLTFPWSSDDE